MPSSRLKSKNNTLFDIIMAKIDTPFRTKTAKNLPGILFGATHTYIAHIREYRSLQSEKRAHGITKNP